MIMCIFLTNVPLHNKTQTISGSSEESNIATPIGSDGSDSSGIGFVTSFSAIPCLVHSSSPLFQIANSSLDVLYYSKGFDILRE
jgi:hypothetical protein